MSLRFEWSTRKATANLLKHGVSFEEALTVFADPLARIFEDEVTPSTSYVRSSSATHLRTGCSSCALRRRGSRLESLVHAQPREQNEKTMRKTSKPKRSGRDEMRQEYQFEYSKSRLNRFASRMKRGAVAVVLDPDVASVFRSPESVNSLLRSVIKALSRNPRHRRVP